MKDVAKEQGCQAFTDSKTPTDNPYPPGSFDNSEWCRGYTEAHFDKLSTPDRASKAKGAPFGWTVVARGGDPKDIHVYKRDCPADAKHFAADLAPFTHATKALAVAAGKRGEYAYKREPIEKVDGDYIPDT